MDVTWLYLPSTRKEPLDRIPDVGGANVVSTRTLPSATRQRNIFPRHSVVLYKAIGRPQVAGQVGTTRVQALLGTAPKHGARMGPIGISPERLPST